MSRLSSFALAVALAVFAPGLLAEVPYDELVAGIQIPQGSYVDTGYVVKSAPKVTMTCKVLSLGSGRDVDLFGTLTAHVGCFILNADQGSFYLRNGTTSGTTVANGFTLNESFEIVCDRTLIKNGSALKTVAAGDFSSNTETLTFPGRRRPYYALTVGTFKLEDGDKLVCDMVACRVGETLCFYDKVSGTCFPITGTGTPVVDAVMAPKACVWTGAAGDGKWSTPANWADGVAPRMGHQDRLFLSDVAGTTFENDIEGLDVGFISLTGARTLTLNGQPLAFPRTSGVVWTNDCSVACNVPLAVATGSSFFIDRPSDFHGAITASGTGTFTLNSQKTSSGDVTFHAAISVPDGNLALNASDPAFIHCLGAVTCRELCSSGRFYPVGTIMLHQPLQQVTRLQIEYREFSCMAADVLNPQMIVEWTGGVTGGRLFLNGYDQTVNCLGGYYLNGTDKPADAANPVGSGRELTSKDDTKLENHLPATLTLAATRSAETAAIVNGKVSLVYDAQDAACVQTFSYRPNATYGTITVKKGTIKLDKGASFLNVPALIIGAAGVFEIGEDNGVANPLPALARIELENGAQLRVPAGVTLTAERVFLDGAALDAAALQDATWLTGGGTLQIASSSVNHWKSPVSGSWRTAANWSDGVPAVGRRTVVDVGGTSGDGYTISVDADAAAIDRLSVDAVGTKPVTLAIGAQLPFSGGAMDFGRNANVEVRDGGTLAYDGGTAANAQDLMAIDKGAKLTVKSGGKVDITRAQSPVTLGGDFRNPSRLVIEEGGEFSHRAGVKAKPVNLLTGGNLDIAGTFRIWQLFDKNQLFSQAGGTVTVSGNGIFDAPIAESHYSYLTFGTGTTIFKDNAVLTFTGNDGNSNQLNTHLRFMPTAAGDSVMVVFTNSSQMVGHFGAFRMGSSLDGYTRLDVHSANCFNQDAAVRSGYFAYSGRVGQGGGTTIMNIMAPSSWKLQCNGLGVGHLDGNVAETKLSRAELNLSNGAQVTVEAKCAISRGQSSAQRKALLSNFGLIVGSNHKATVITTRPMKGKVTLVGEDTGIEVLKGHLMLGVGDGEGEMVMTGGSVGLSRNATSESSNNDQYYTGVDATYPVYSTNNVFALGLHGGRGVCTIAGGNFLANMRTFVGGLAKEDYFDGWNIATNNSLALADSMASEGVLRITGGIFEGRHGVYVGAKGRGELEFGPAGTFTAPELVLSNNVESVVRFAFDPETGYAGSVAVNRLVIAPGAKLEVDLANAKIRRSWTTLIHAPILEGRFAPENITVRGDVSGRAVIEQDARGISVHIVRGLIVNVR